MNTCFIVIMAYEFSWRDLAKRDPPMPCGMDYYLTGPQDSKGQGF